jgi:hypothetical protein
VVRQVTPHLFAIDGTRLPEPTALCPGSRYSSSCGQMIAGVDSEEAHSRTTPSLHICLPYDGVYIDPVLETNLKIRIQISKIQSYVQLRQPPHSALPKWRTLRSFNCCGRI